MRRVVKTYYPMFFSILLSFVFGFILKGTLVNFTNYSDTLMWVFVGLTLFMVIAIWAEIIGFIIHACKNKDLDNRVGWSFLIYFFNIFVIPYYNLKYVVKESKLKSKMIIFILLLIGSFITGFLVINNNSKNVYITENHLQFKFNAGYIKREVGEYDIYASDYNREINIGAFIYDETYSASVEYIRQIRDNWLKTSRENVQELDKYEETIEDKNIISKIYSGGYEGEKYIYQISTVEFKEKEYVVEVLQVVNYDDYDSLKEELKEILRNIKYKD